MKRALFLIIGAFIGTTLLAQSDIEIIHPAGNHSINDSTITIVGNNGFSQYLVGFSVINTGNITINVKCRWQVLSAAPHTSNQICWVNCYGATGSPTYTAPSTASMSKQGGGTDTNTTFVGYFNDSNNVSTEIIKYVFYNSINPNDTAAITVKYIINSDAGVPTIASPSLHLSVPSPNPAERFATINYRTNTQSRLTLYNSIGQAVKEIVLNPSETRLSLNVADIPSGIYICKLAGDGAEPVFQKLVVAH